MNNTDRHPECHMRTALGNCDPIGGFCTSVNEPICEALHKVSRPHGEWIDMGDFEQCSVCKGTHLKEFKSYYGKTTWIKTPYCPNCGARMVK